MKKDLIQHYLANYSEPESRVSLEKIEAAQVVVIPVTGEQSLEPLLRSLDQAVCSAKQSLLSILVINHRPNSPQVHQSRNRGLMKAFPPSLELSDAPPMFLVQRNPEHQLLVIDRCSHSFQFPLDQGVGLARKIGCDIALALIHHGQVSEAWIRTTDADVEVPMDYLLPRNESADAVCLIYPYAHYSSADVPTVLKEAQRLYESYLYYYERGLRFARSQYAFQTIGSCLMFKAKAYAQVRGFPKKMAGEDFYLLNKLAKVGKVRPHGGQFLKIATRESDRVPFGTGSSVMKIKKLLLNKEPYEVYHPHCFQALKTTRSLLQDFATSSTSLSAKQWIEENHGLHCNVVLRNIFESIGLYQAMDTAIETRPTAPQRIKHLEEWFDAFRTLKFIHRVRDQCFGTLPLEQALAVGDEMGILAPINPK